MAGLVRGGRRHLRPIFPTAGIGVQNQQLAGRAALAGQGVAILMPAFFRGGTASGQLVQPFPIVKQLGREPYWLVYPEARRRSPKIRAFRDWILAEVGKAERSGAARRSRICVPPGR